MSLDAAVFTVGFWKRNANGIGGGELWNVVLAPPGDRGHEGCENEGIWFLPAFSKAVALPTSRARGSTWKASKAFSEGFDFKGQVDLPLL